MGNKIIIIGYGVIGKLEYKILEKLKPYIYDKYNQSNNTANLEEEYDFAIICVPTPLKDNSCDTSEVWNAVNEVKAKIYIIKSTVAVGTCDKIAVATSKHIVHSPEHSGATQHCNNFEYNFTILGGDKKDCYKVQQMYQEVFDARHTFKVVDRQTSELSKYMLNSYLAMKVSFCSQFWKVCQELDIPYEELRECFTLDPRINSAHTFIYDEHPYWQSHCFDKDIPSIMNQFDMELLKDIISQEDQCHTVLIITE